MRKKVSLARLTSQTFPQDYDTAINRERAAWRALFQFKRSEPEYTLALEEWRAAADALTALTIRDLVQSKGA